MNWKITQHGYDEHLVPSIGNRMLIGNGYLGIRGTLEEDTKEQLVACNLAGIYDQVGDGWREPVNAPNALYTYISVGDDIIKLPQNKAEFHCYELNYRDGRFIRKTTWNTRDGEVTVESERFASLSDVHLIANQYRLTVKKDMIVTIYTGIDADVWDIHGPHYDDIHMNHENSVISVTATTHEKKEQVVVMKSCITNFPAAKQVVIGNRSIIQEITIMAKADQTYVLDGFATVFTSKDCSNPAEMARKSLLNHCHNGYELELNQQKECWEEIWKHTEVEIDGDDEACKAINYSLYHLQSIAPRHTNGFSIAARGLSGQTYKGAVFWDTEIFMLDFFLLMDPDVARSLLKYRIDTLEGAKKKAITYGYQGAFYAWESQEGGYDACSDYNVVDVFTGRPMRTFFKDKQVHISAAIVYGIHRYIELTGDVTILDEGGAETVIECARFYYDLLSKKLTKQQYEIHDVIGPDEYHERVNNNGYTNRMAKFTFANARKVIKEGKKLEESTRQRLSLKYNLKDLEKKFEDAEKNIYIPMPDKNNIIPQFDGYMELEDATVEEVRSRLLNEKEYWGGAYGVASQTKVIKQADVIAWLSLFPKDFSPEINQANWDYYEKRTEHGSSLSACMYGILACHCGMPDVAYPLFMTSARVDLSGKGKEWAGLVYIGGTHPAAAGGAYMMIERGFAGISFEKGKLKINPRLPKHWKKLKLHVVYQGSCYEIDIRDDGTSEIKEMEIA